MSTTMTPPPLGQPGFDIHASQTGTVIGSSVALIVLATIFVTLRLTSRWVARAGFWWDDVAIVIAWSFALVPSILNIWGTRHAGIGQHIWALHNPKGYITKARIFLYVFQIFFALSTATVKLCTLLFYRRIFPIRVLRPVLLIMAAVVISFLIASVGVAVFQCAPIHKYWDFNTAGTCLPVYNTLIVTGSFNTALDFLIVLLPVPLLWRLQTSTKQKCLLTTIFTMAGFVCIVSIVRLCLWTKMNRVDITWNSVNINAWSATEPIAGVICACITSLRPLWSLTYRSLSSSRLSASQLSPLGRKGSIFSRNHLSMPAPEPRRTMSDSLGVEHEDWYYAGGGDSQKPWGHNAKAYRGSTVTVEKIDGQSKKKREAKCKPQVPEVPFGVIRVKTDMRVSVYDKWEYRDRVF